MSGHLLTLAVLLGAVSHGGSGAAPEGWAIIAERHDAGRDFYVFESLRGDVVVAVPGMNQPRDLIAALEHRADGYRAADLAFARGAMEAAAGRFWIVGHSLGGGLASWMGGELDAPTVTFNAGRPPAAGTHDGGQQVHVVICGDGFGDPIDGHRGGNTLPGELIRLAAAAGARTHPMPTVIAALANGGTGC